jgi:putative ATPase
VPVHLRNAPAKRMTQLGHGREYRDAHGKPNAYAAGGRCMPDEPAEPAEPAEPDWYRPVPRGLESRIAEKLGWLRELDAQARRPG